MDRETRILTQLKRQERQLRRRHARVLADLRSRAWLEPVRDRRTGELKSCYCTS